jgi:hypothetical protein
VPLYSAVPHGDGDRVCDQGSALYWKKVQFTKRLLRLGNEEKAATKRKVSLISVAAHKEKLPTKNGLSKKSS